MPIRSMMTITPDDSVQALREDTFTRAHERYVAAYCAEHPKRDPALVAFETGDHAPSIPVDPEPGANSAGQPVAYLNRITSVIFRQADNRKGAESLVGSAWHITNCGWSLEEFQGKYFTPIYAGDPRLPAASEPVKRGGWVMRKKGDTCCPIDPAATVWVRLRCGVVSCGNHWGWHASGVTEYSIIAYSTDDTCPEWTGEAAQ